MPFVGLGIFTFVALLCIVAFFAARRQRRRYEETGRLPGDDDQGDEQVSSRPST